MANLKMTPELETAIRAASSNDDIQTLIRTELDKQTAAEAADVAAQAAAKVAADKAAADKAAADAAAAAGAGGGSVTRTEVIGGKALEFVAESEQKLNEMVLNAYRVYYATVGTTPQAQETRVDAAKVEAEARAAAELEVARQTELQTKMQRGEISVSDYLKQSGAVADYLQDRGISIDTLKTAVEQSQSQALVQSWSQATEQFLQGPGAKWPGGDKNMAQMEMALATLGLSDQPSVDSLVKAYEYLTQRDAIFANNAPLSAEEKSAATKVVTATAAVDAANAKTAELTGKSQAEIQKIIDDAVAQALAKNAADAAAAAEAAKTPRTSSSLFNASSGLFAPGGSGAGSTEAKIRSDAATSQVLQNASPAEILEAWKAAQVAGGKNPNEAFLEQFAARR